MVIGPRWDKYNLNPWVYDLKEDTWSNKLTPNGKTLPPLPVEDEEIFEEMLYGNAVFIGNTVYWFKSTDALILDLSTLENWSKVALSGYCGNHPVVVPFSPTLVAIVGGWGNSLMMNTVEIFNTETRTSQV